MERADSPPRTALKLRNTQERTLFWLVPKKQAIRIIVLVRSCRYPAATREAFRSNPLWPATSFDRRAPCPPAKVAAGYRSQRRWRSTPRNPVSGPVETAHSLAERGVCGRRHSFVDGKDVPAVKEANHLIAAHEEKVIERIGPDAHPLLLAALSTFRSG